MKTLRLLILLPFALVATSPATEPALGPKPDETMAAAAEFLKAMQQGLGGTNALSSVDFRRLRELLPVEAAGLKRTKASGQKSGAMGASISVAEGVYSDGKEASLDVKLTDMAAMGGLAAVATGGFMGAEIDSETDEGYERTKDFQGHKGLEKFDTTAGSGSVHLVVAGRFLVEVSGRGITPAQLEGMVNAIDLAKLAALAPSASTKP